MRTRPQSTRALHMRFLAILVTALACTSLGFGVPAFPGAQGFGSDTPGGRGGTVIKVTNLNDSGAGSFRAAVTASGPRIVVFNVAGEIKVQSMIIVTNPYLTIAGQTAPGSGITIRNDPNTSSGQKPLRISTHDVVIRYLRFRPGNDSGTDNGNLDALGVGDDAGTDVYNVVVDHCSFSWGTDEVLSTSARDLTLSWNIVSEGLDDSTHPQGRHSKGLHLLGESTTDSDNITLHHNLLAHNLDRNPDINTSGVVDVVNNVYYNAIAWTLIKNKWSLAQVNLVKNYYKQGPDFVSGEGTYKQSINGWEVLMSRDADNSTKQPEVYLEGNIGWHRPTDSGPQDAIVRRSNVYPFNPEDEWLIVKPTRFAAPAITTTSAVSAFANVLADAGANKRIDQASTFALVSNRDSVDSRIVNDTANGTGHFKNVVQSSDWAAVVSGTVATDSDGDGMPNAWESLHGVSSATADADGDGYTNIEEYLNGTNPNGAGGDVIAPTVSITSPTNGATVSGTIAFAATASDNVGVTDVAFYRDDILLGEDTTSPYSFSWNTTTVTNGQYPLTAVASDAAGNAGFSNIVTVTVSNTAGTVAAPAFNPPAGTYSSAQSVTISSATSGASIRYTTNGSTPTSTSGTVYSGPVNISDTKTLKAIAYKSGMTNSSVTTGVYTINSGGGSSEATFISVAAYDGWVTESGENTNVGGSLDAGGASIRIGDTSAKLQYKTILSFDTSSLPDSATIQSATLRLTRRNVTGTVTSANFGGIKVDVKSGAFGNLALESGDFQAAATATNVATLPFPANDGDVTSDNLIAAGSAAINKTGVTQFRVYFTLDDDNDGANDYLGFESGENTTTGLRPTLVITYQDGTSNVAPTVSITSPADEATFTAPASVTINATAADSDGTVTKVDFYRDSTLLGTDTSSPYSYAWSNVAAGSYTLTAKATDNSGAVTTSGAVDITVNSGGGGSEATFTSVATHDGWVKESGENTNVGGGLDAGGASIRIGDTSAKLQYKTILSFDTSSLPDSATIQSATLRLTRRNVTGTVTSANFGGIKVDVKSGTFGNLALENGDFQAAATATNVATLPFPANDGDVTSDNLIEAGRAAINKTGVTQFRVYFTLDDDNDGANDYLGFESGENTTTGLRPTLVITYQ